MKNSIRTLTAMCAAVLAGLMLPGMAQAGEPAATSHGAPFEASPYRLASLRPAPRPGPMRRMVCCLKNDRYRFLPAAQCNPALVVPDIKCRKKWAPKPALKKVCCKTQSGHKKLLVSQCRPPHGHVVPDARCLKKPPKPTLKKVCCKTCGGYQKLSVSQCRQSRGWVAPDVRCVNEEVVRSQMNFVCCNRVHRRLKNHRRLMCIPQRGCRGDGDTIVSPEVCVRQYREWTEQEQKICCRHRIAGDKWITRGQCKQLGGKVMRPTDCRGGPRVCCRKGGRTWVTRMADCRLGNGKVVASGNCRWD